MAHLCLRVCAQHACVPVRAHCAVSLADMEQRGMNALVRRGPCAHHPAACPLIIHWHRVDGGLLRLVLH